MRLRCTPPRLAAVLVPAFIVFLAGRHLARLPSEIELLFDPPIAALIGGLLLACVLAGRSHRSGAWAGRLAPLVLIAAIVCNLIGFAGADPSRRITSFHVRPDARLSSLGDMPGWDNHWSIYKLYTYLHDRMRGSTIVAYSPPTALHDNFDTLLHPYYLRYLSEISDYRVERYEHELTPSRLTWLRTRPHAEFEDYNTKLRWLIVETPGPLVDTYVVLTGDGLHVLAREELLATVRAQ